MAGHGFSHTPVSVPKVRTKYRTIQTQIPVPESLPILETIYRCESRSMHGQMPVLWDKAEGFQVSDAWGNTWLDFTSTIFVTNAGHGNARIRAALQEQLDKPLLHTYTYATKVRADYLSYLIQHTPAQFEKAFLLSAGTEATECGLKLMRLHGRAIGKKRPGVIAFEGNWHGRTVGAQSLSYNAAQKEWIGHQDPNIFHLPFPYPWRPEAVKNPRQYFRETLAALCERERLNPATDFCGVMMETFQGWGAVFYPPEFVQEVEAFAKENQLLLGFDEMQAGFGRTGTLFGYMHYDIQPDLLCCGKGAASSLPLSLVLGSARVMDLPDIGSMSSTHSANPLVCAAGLANLQALLEDGLIENSRTLGELFQCELEALRQRHPKHIGRVMGKGLLAALHFTDPQGNPLSPLCDRICEEAMRRGLLLVHTGRESIKLAPPLCISEDALREGITVLGEVARDCSAAL